MRFHFSRKPPEATFVICTPPVKATIAPGSDFTVAFGAPGPRLKVQGGGCQFRP